MTSVNASIPASRSTGEEHRLFEAVCATKRRADATEDPADLRAAAAAYRTYMRFHLTDPEREVLRLEDVVAALTVENRLLKAQLDMAGRRIEAMSATGRRSA